MRLLVGAVTLLVASVAGAAAVRAEPAEVESWVDATAHTKLTGFTPRGDALLVRSVVDFSRSLLGRARCGPDGCDGFEALVLPGWGSARGASVLPDGSLLLTSSEATHDPRASDAWNLFVAAPAGDGWEQPRPLPFPVGSPFAECCATPAPAGGFYFASDRAGTWDIYAATPNGTGGYGVERLAALSSEPATPGDRGYFSEWPSYADPAGRFLLLSSIRPGGVGGDDVFVACAAPGGGWLPPRNLGAPVNTPGYEDGAQVAPDGRTLYWSSRPVQGGTSRVLSLPFDDRELCPLPPPPAPDGR